MSETPNYYISRLDENPNEKIWGYPRLNNYDDFMDIIYNEGKILMKSGTETKEIDFKNIDQMRKLYLHELRNNFCMVLNDPPLCLSSYSKIKNFNNVKFPIYGQKYYDGLRCLIYKKGVYFSNKLYDHSSMKFIKLFLDYLPRNCFIDCVYWCPELNKNDIKKVFKNEGYVTTNKKIKDKIKYDLTCYVNDIYIDDYKLKERIEILKNCYEMFIEEFKNVKYFEINFGETYENEESLTKNLILKKLDGSYYFENKKDFFLI